MSENTPRNVVPKQRWLPLTSPPSSPGILPVRSALAELPALPMHQRPEPATSKTLPADAPVLRVSRPFTPPSTPQKPEKARASAIAHGIERVLPIDLDLGAKPSPMPEVKTDQASWQEAQRQDMTPKQYMGKYQLYGVLGRGAWSTVYRSIENDQPMRSLTNLPPTPPTSPIASVAASDKKVLAVKVPSSRQAHRILETEAKILTYIHSHANASTYLVALHGFDSAQHSIVLDAIPLNLEAHAKSAIGRPFSTKTMFDPVIGAEEWAGLAEDLIGGLDFLHSVSCVHGDIKPANILLRPGSSGKLTPLYCDFSSSHIVFGKGEEEVEEVSAVTPEYLAPELLEALSPRNPARAVAGCASDVFALGVTLLFAAVGESPYAGARMASQKLEMAKEGMPFEFARRGEQASRVMKGRAVERALRSALAKEVAERVVVGEWRDQIAEVARSWQESGWARGG